MRPSNVHLSRGVLVGIKLNHSYGYLGVDRSFYLVSVSLLTLFVSALLAAPGSAFEISFAEIPQSLQLFARGADDSARVVVSGVVSPAGYDSVRLELDRNGEPWGIASAPIEYDFQNEGSFEVAVRIYAELAEYGIQFFVDDSLITVRENLVCGDVYLINGQSNSVAADYDNQAHYQSEWLRSFGTSAYSAGEVEGDTEWGVAQGHFAYYHAAVGVWGLWLGSELVERHGTPIAILNGGVGGTPIVQFLRNDSFPTDLNTIYGRLLWRTAMAGIQGDIKAMLWHQGENDTNEQHAHYLSRFTSLWNAWHEDFSSLEHVYVFQIHPGCGWDRQSEIREIQRTLPDGFPNLDVMSTVGLVGHDGCHYSFEGYNQMGLWVSRLMNRDFYESSDTLHIRPPNVIEAWFTDSTRDELRIRFDEQVVWPPDTLGASMVDYFALDGEWGHVLSGYVDGDGLTVVLELVGPTEVETVTYLPNKTYHNYPNLVYQGPWLRNPRSVGALSFLELPIAPVVGVGAENHELLRTTLTCAPCVGASSVRMTLTLPLRAQVRLSVYDAGGRLVSALHDGAIAAGTHQVIWNGEGNSGAFVGAGVYYVELNVDSQRRATKRLVVLR